MVGDWGEVVTRYPYRKVWMDHLLSKEYLIARLKHLGHFARAFFVHYLLFGFEGLDVLLKKAALTSCFFFVRNWDG